MKFLHQYSAPRLLHSTADYDCQSCFEHFGSQLNVDWGYNLLGRQLLYDLLFLLFHRYTGCSPCNVRIHRSLATSWNKSGVYRLISSGNIANKVTYPKCPNLFLTGKLEKQMKFCILQHQTLTELGEISFF